MDSAKVLLSIMITLGLLATPLLAARVSAEAEPGYQYFVEGDSANVAPATTPGLLLMGGSTDVDSAFQWMIDHSGGGDFLVIRASGTDAYNPYIYSELGGTVNSAATLIIKKERATYDPFVIETIRNAEALFIAGGNQWDYVRDWKGTPVEDAIQFLVSRGVPIGGTSAGLAVLGEFSFSAEHGTITSNEALKNPYHTRLALAKDFLTMPHLNGVITDSHFVARDRMGRLVTFLARILKDTWADKARGIAINERTALTVEASGIATLHGEGPVYFLETTTFPEVCEKTTPLTFRDVAVHRLDLAGQSFDLSAWPSSDGASYSLSAVDGELVSTQAGGAIY